MSCRMLGTSSRVAWKSRTPLAISASTLRGRRRRLHASPTPTHAAAAHAMVLLSTSMLCTVRVWKGFSKPKPPDSLSFENLGRLRLNDEEALLLLTRTAIAQGAARSPLASAPSPRSRAHHPCVLRERPRARATASRWRAAPWGRAAAGEGRRRRRGDRGRPRARAEAAATVCARRSPTRARRARSARAPTIRADARAMPQGEKALAGAAALSCFAALRAVARRRARRRRRRAPPPPPPPPRRTRARRCAPADGADGAAPEPPVPARSRARVRRGTSSRAGARRCAGARRTGSTGCARAAAACAARRAARVPALPARVGRDAAPRDVLRTHEQPRPARTSRCRAARA